MKLTIEEKNKEFTVRCGDLVAKAPSLRDAIAKIAEEFKARLMRVVDAK